MEDEMEKRAKDWEEALKHRGLLIQVLSGFAEAQAGARYSKAEVMEELESEAWIAMLRAVETYDKAKGFTFSTYASVVLKNHLISVWKKLSRPLQMEISLDALLQDDEDNDPSTWVDVEKAWGAA